MRRKIFKPQNVIRMKKILSTLLVAIFASLVHAQITGEFMGLTMGISSMEDAIEVLEEEWIEYEVDDSSSSIHFEHDVELEGYEAEEGFMMFYNDQLVMLMVMTTCDEDTENCKYIKRGLKTNYVDLEDDLSNLLIHSMLSDVESKWVKKDDRMSVFYASEDGELVWGYAMPIDNVIKSIYDVMEGTIDYLNLLDDLMGL